MDGWISKRELLEATGISYGQLYRWKREGLIPGGWFVKRSAFTGQETFLPRDRAIERIQFILENKDKFTLQQLLDQLTPVPGSRTYPAERVASLPSAARPAAMVARLIGGDAFDHGQALCAMIGADLLARTPADDEGLEAVLRALLHWQALGRVLEQDDGRIAVLLEGGRFLPLCVQPDAAIRAPEGVKVAYQISLSDLPERCTRPLNQLLEGEE
ncbi:MAG: DUF4004 family protein [Clostridiales bacterium]|nr:DUF4004 family protein [Clostridiales bacterium]